MNRLTGRDEFGNADIIALSDTMPEIYAGLSFSEANALTNALNRLADYEDTGLSPEEVNRLKERISPISPGGDDKIDEMEEALDNLRFQLSVYEQKIADGRMIVLPCKVGDTVYEIQYNHCCTCPDRDYYNIKEKKFSLDMLNKINNTVFLTREEVEQVLKGCEKK